MLLLECRESYEKIYFDFKLVGAYILCTSREEHLADIDFLRLFGNICVTHTKVIVVAVVKGGVLGPIISDIRDNYIDDFRWPTL